MMQSNRRSHLALAAALAPVLSLAGDRLVSQLPESAPPQPSAVAGPLQPNRWLPESTIASVSFAGLRNLSAWGDEHRLVGLIESSVDRVMPALGERQRRRVARSAQRIERALGRLGMDTAELQDLLGGQVLIGVGRPAIVDEHPMPSLLAVVDCRGRPGAGARLGDAIERLVRAHARRSGLRTKAKIDGHLVHSIEGISLWWTEVDGVAVVSQSLGCLRDCLRVHAGQANAAEDQSAGARPERTVANLQVHTTPLRQAVAWMLPYEAEPILDALGWTSIDGASLSIGVGRERGDELIARIGAKLPADGLLRSAIGQPASHDAARLCSKDALVYATGRFDVRSALRAGKRLIDALPEPLRRELEREVVPELRRELRHVDMTIPDLLKLVQSFGPQWTLSMSAPGGARVVPEGLLVVESPRPKDLVELLVHTVGSAELGRWKSAQFRGHTIHYLSGLRSEVPVTPAVVALDEAFVIGTSVGAVKGALRRAAAQAVPEDSLAADSEFRAAVASEAKASMFALVRLRNSLPRYYRMVQPMAEGLVERELGLDPDVLPSSDDLVAALADLRIACTLDDAGVMVRMQGPIGTGSFLVGGHALMKNLLRNAQGQPQPRRPEPKKKGRIY